MGSALIWAAGGKDGTGAQVYRLDTPRGLYVISAHPVSGIALYRGAAQNRVLVSLGFRSVAAAQAYVDRLGVSHAER